MIAYNSILLSMLLERYQATGDQRALDLLKKISPVAWQHIHFLAIMPFATIITPSTLRRSWQTYNWGQPLD